MLLRIPDRGQRGKPPFPKRIRILQDGRPKVSVSLTKSDGCGKNNDCLALGPGLRYFEDHEPPLFVSEYYNVIGELRQSLS